MKERLQPARGLAQPRRLEPAKRGYVRACGVGLLLMVAIATAAHDAAQAPAISVATRLVQIGVVVRDKNGPVVGLTKDDFVVLDRGKAREVALFSLDAGQPNVAAVMPLPHNTFSDLPRYEANAPRSVTVVLLDNLNTLYGSAAAPYESAPTWFEDLALANAKAHLAEFVKELDPRDRVAIYGLSRSLHVLCDFTSDRGQLLAVLKKYETHSVTNRETVEPGATHTPVPGDFNAAVDATDLAMAGMANQVRATATMDALQAIAGHVANIPGRKNLVWLTANLPLPGTAIASILSPAGIAAYPVDGRGLLTATPPGGVEGVMDEDAAARGHYMPAQSPQPLGISSMLEMAEETGGQAFTNTNDLTGAIRTAVEGSNVIYTLGFYLDAESLDGKFHRLKVRVKRSGDRVQCPSGYFAYRERDEEQQEKRRVLSAMVSPLQSASIPVQVRIQRVDAPLPNSLSLFGSIDLHHVSLRESDKLRKGAVRVITVEQDDTGQVLRQSASRITLSFSESQYAKYLKSGFPFHQIVQPAKHVVRLRIVVEDTVTTEVGSLIIPLSEIE